MDDLISKTQKKRDAEAVYKLGLTLIGLPKDKLDQLPLSETLREAIDEAKAIKSHGASKRQGLYIGKLMRREDHEAILKAYEDLHAEAEGKTVQFHEVEQWRHKLIAEDKEVLTAFIERYPEVDAQKLRQLIKKAKVEKETAKDLGAMKALFRFLREYIVSQDRDQG